MDPLCAEETRILLELMMQLWSKQQHATYRLSLTSIMIAGRGIRLLIFWALRDPYPNYASVALCCYYSEASSRDSSPIDTCMAVRATTRWPISFLVDAHLLLYRFHTL